MPPAGQHSPWQRNKTHMKKKRKKRSILLGLFCLVGLAAGIIIMLYYPYCSHKQTLINKAADIAADYSKEQALSINGYFGMSYLVYDPEGNCVDKVVSGFSDMTFVLDTEKYLDALKENEVQLRYEWLEISMQSRSRHQLALVAAVPIKTDGHLTGILFLVRELEEVLNNLLSFTIIWLCAFGLLFLFLFLLAKKEQELDTLQRTYIAAMNHELKTPITAIKALAETLLDGYITDSEKQMFYYSTILKEARTLEDTVQEILELSRLQSTKTLYKKETVNAADIFTPVLERYAMLCEDIDIQFVSPDLKTISLSKLYTAPGLAARILDLLLHNAVKFTESGSGQIQVTYDLKKDCVIFHVRDNGCGICADALPHIFERFYQTEKGRSKNGSGLGLSLVKEMADGLEEKVWAESREGKGSVFSFTVGIKP